MLSFLREQGNGELPAQKPDAAGTESTEGIANQQEQEYLTVATPKKRTRKSTTLLAILFIIGLLCLGYMIKKSTPQAASAASDDTENTQVEAAIARITGVKSEMFSSMDEIIRKFYEFSDVLQVKVGELVKNPFKIEMVTADKKEESRVEIKVPEIDVELAQKKQIRQKAKEMKLLSIMQSESDRGACCMIADKILYEGDYIREFRVRKIGDGFVKLVWDPSRSNESSENDSDTVEIMLMLSE